MSDPSGIKVFGSAEVRAPADSAVISFEVSAEADAPAGAFAAAHEASATVLDFLRSVDAQDVKSSQISLRQQSQFIEGPKKQRTRTISYVARIGHRVTWQDLDRLEMVLSGVVEAGANELRSVEFATTRLAELRRQARRDAVAAGRAKAELYADAAEVTLGAITAIEDVNPDGESGPRTRGESQGRDAGDGAASEAGMIEVAGRVRLWFAIA